MPVLTSTWIWITAAFSKLVTGGSFRNDAWVRMLFAPTVSAVEEYHGDALPVEEFQLSSERALSIGLSRDRVPA